MQGSHSRFTGAFPTDNPQINRCHWSHFQDGSCPYGPFGCTTILPGPARFDCDAGYDRTVDNRCVQNLPPEDGFAECRPPNPTAGNPIILGTGAKYYEVEDFATQDSRFRIARQYRSFAGGRVSSYNVPGLTPAVGWRYSFDYELHLGEFSGSPSSPTGRVTLLTPDGAGYDFALQSNGLWQAQAAMGMVSNSYKLEFVGALPSNLADMKAMSRQWKLTGPGDRVWVLSTMSPVNQTPESYRVGRPTSMHERDGYAWELNYSADGALASIVDGFGRTATFTWNYYYPLPNTSTPGPRPMPEAVKDITFPDGTKVTYLYDPAPAATPPSQDVIKHVAGVEWRNQSGAVIDSNAYHYEDANYPKFLTGVSDHRGVRVATYTYDAEGRAISTEGAGGANRVTVAYGTSGSQLTRTVTNALGRVSVYKFDHVAGSSWDIRFAGVDGQASTNCPASASSVAYDAVGYVASQTDEEGRVTNYVNDSRGRPTQITQATGRPEQRQTNITWHATLEAPEEIAAPGLTTHYTYNTLGQLANVTQTDTTTHIAPYATAGQSRSWTYTYLPGGLLSSIDGPLPGTGDTISYTYDASGYVATVTDEVGNVTTVNAVNGRGQPTEIQDANGLVAALSYDARGRLKSKVEDPSGISARTEFEYDNAGNITKVTNPDASFLVMEYDGANRVTSVTNSLGDKTDYTYDALGNLANEKRTDVNTQLFFEQIRTFDELGRLRKIIGVGSHAWTYGYDKVSNPTSVTDPNGNSAASSYDGLNRLIAFADERNSNTATTYGPSDQPATITDPRNVVTAYVRNGWGEVIQEQSPDIGTSVYLRNQLGQITQRTDARGIVTAFAYDNDGRMTSRTYPSETILNVTYTYDGTTGGNAGKGRLTGVTDSAGTVSYVYDRFGHVQQEMRVVGSRSYSIAYAWDDSGNLQSVTYPSGRVVEYGRGLAGEVQQVRTSPDAVSSPTELVLWSAYAPFGPRSITAFANDLRETREYDLDGRITGYGIEDQSLGQDLIRKILRYQDKRNLTAIEDQLNPANSEIYSYTANGSIENATGPWGALAYLTDGVGNITQRSVAVGGVTSTDSYTIQPGSNRLSGIVTDGTPSRSFQSDLAGNINADTTASPSANKAYAYNAAGQLAGATISSAAAGSYVYDYQSRLVSRTNHTVPVTVHMVHDLDGNVIAEYDATSGTLLTEYVWVDGRPLAMVANAGTAPSLYYVLTDHIERPVMMVDESRTVVWQASYLPFGEVRSISGSATLDLRFPGQWFQMETGLSYNWHRHYDPSIGRYLQPDPLGMPDGPSRYAYVNNSPLMKVDPEGLQAGSQMSVIPPPPPVGPPMCKVGTVTQICTRIGIETGFANNFCRYRCPDQSIRGVSFPAQGAQNDNCPAKWSFSG
ncbi:RHS repeat-associated core domain-containing protein [Mesorhizobium sp. 1M-11]|uniref:RHS repeat-associated core domain-containing protein n=1 Tax=Mesorhizobium sp. 1M-11 TaxID=1529006 RepID=UPI000B0ED790|nr:RHS repeat-associated core domain-containing protein [Mesorhizobium sp. 1M-11]